MEEKNGGEGCGAHSRATPRERGRERAPRRGKSEIEVERRVENRAAEQGWMRREKARGGGSWGRIGWVVCCGLLRLGRSSAPATDGGFSRR